MSFPSGHVFGSVVVYGLIAAIVLRRLRLTWPRWGVLGVTIVLVISVGLARVGLGAHWPSDVVGGVLLGCAYLAVGIRALRLDAPAPSARPPLRGRPPHESPA